MRVAQRSPLNFGPSPAITQVLVTDTPGTTSTVTNQGVGFQRQTSASFHYDALLSGIGVQDSEVITDFPLDASLFPLIKRDPNWESSGATLPKIRLRNSRGESSDITLDFQQRNGQTSYSNPKTITPGTYAEYSWNRVYAIFDALDDGTPENHKVFGPGQVRRQTSIIPHHALTCQIAGAGGGINNVGGHLRMYAITPRHCVQIAHSGNGTHQNFQAKFIDVNGNAVFRTVVADYNVGYGEAGVVPPGVPADIRIYVLDSDLPASIVPAPFVGDWFFNYTGTAKAGTTASGAFGFASFNQDTHICPIQRANPTPFTIAADYEMNIGGTVVAGREFGSGWSSEVNLEGFQSWGWSRQNAVVGEWYADRPFHHFIRAGDSGSPVFWPVGDNKWAVGAGMISGSMWRPAAINALIAYINDDMGIVGTYEVEVAPNPV